MAAPSCFHKPAQGPWGRGPGVGPNAAEQMDWSGLGGSGRAFSQNGCRDPGGGWMAEASFPSLVWSD